MFIVFQRSHGEEQQLDLQHHWCMHIKDAVLVYKMDRPDSCMKCVLYTFTLYQDWCATLLSLLIAVLHHLIYIKQYLNLPLKPTLREREFLHAWVRRRVFQVKGDSSWKTERSCRVKRSVTNLCRGMIGWGEFELKLMNKTWEGFSLSDRVQSNIQRGRSPPAPLPRRQRRLQHAARCFVSVLNGFSQRDDRFTRLLLWDADELQHQTSLHWVNKKTSCDTLLLKKTDGDVKGRGGSDLLLFVV